MDHPDRAWKVLLQRRLAAVLARLFPEIHALVDWTEQYYLPDKALLPVTPDGRTGDREPDFVAIVMLLDGSRACIHIEVQCTRKAHFAERMEIYRARLRDRFAVPVISLALLGDRSPGWRPDSSSDLRDGCGTTFRFRTAKLLDFQARLDELAGAPEPAALAIAAHLHALVTRGRPDARYALKLRLLRSLYTFRGDVEELNEMQKIIDWMMPLPVQWQRRMTMEVDEQGMWDYEKEPKNSLNYLIPKMLVERGRRLAAGEGEARGRAEGEARGRVEGVRETLRLLLEIRFGKLPAKLKRAIGLADPGQLERLAIALLDAETLDGALSAAGLGAGSD